MPHGIPSVSPRPGKVHRTDVADGPPRIPAAVVEDADVEHPVGLGMGKRGSPPTPARHIQRAHDPSERSLHGRRVIRNDEPRDPGLSRPRRVLQGMRRTRGLMEPGAQANGRERGQRCAERRRLATQDIHQWCHAGRPEQRHVKRSHGPGGPVRKFHLESGHPRIRNGRNETPGSGTPGQGQRLQQEASCPKTTWLQPAVRAQQGPGRGPTRDPRRPRDPR